MGGITAAMLPRSVGRLPSRNGQKWAKRVSRKEAEEERSVEMNEPLFSLFLLFVTAHARSAHVALHCVQFVSVRADMLSLRFIQHMHDVKCGQNLLILAFNTFF